MTEHRSIQECATNAIKNVWPFQRRKWGYNGAGEQPGGGGGGRVNNVRKNGGKRMYKQYREKNDSTILVTTTEEKENKNHTSKIEEFIMEKG